MLYFVCIILCEIFIPTLLYHTYIFQHFVCIMLCEIFILTLLCPTYIFLHFVCIILCEIFILTLLCHTYIGCQHVSTVVGFLSNVLTSVLQEDHFVCILLCDIFINIVMSCMNVINTGIPRSRMISNRVFHIGLFVSSFVRFLLYQSYSLNVSYMGFARSTVIINRFF